MKRTALLLLATLACSGCFSVDLDDLAREPPAKQRYLFNVSIPQAAEAPSRAGVLLVERAYAAQPYNARPLVFRTGETENRTDYFHEFLVPPADQISEITRDWIRAQGRYRQVIHADGGALATETLSLDLTELRGDLRDEAKPQAVLALRASVSRPGESGEEIILSRAYRTAVATTDASAAAMVDGWSRGLAELLPKLVRDLQKRP